MLIDAIEAIRWAWILLRYGTETVVNRYVDWFIKLVRKHAQRIPNVKSLWEDFSWDIAMSMRANETFQLITEDLMSDVTRVTDTMQQPLTKRPRTGKGADSKAKARDTSNVGHRQARDVVTVPRHGLPHHLLGDHGHRARSNGKANNNNSHGPQRPRRLGKPHRHRLSHLLHRHLQRRSTLLHP